MSSPDWADDPKVMNFEDLEEGEIEEDVDERHDSFHRVTRPFRTTETYDPPPRDNDLRPAASHYRAAKYAKANRKAPYPHHCPPHPGAKSDLGAKAGDPWPKTFVHIKSDGRDVDGSDYGRSGAWDGQHPSPPLPQSSRTLSQRNRARSKDKSRGRWSGGRGPRSKTIHQRPKKVVSKRRSFTDKEMSYEDLLLQHIQIKSQLAELDRQEHPPENVAREVKDDVNKNKPPIDDKVVNDVKAAVDVKKRRTRSQSRARSLSSSKSQVPELNISQEDDEEELRKIALASARNKSLVKKSVPYSQTTFQPSLTISSEHGLSDACRDNYEEVPMELDSNGGTANNYESEDEDNLRNQLLQSLGSKQKTQVQSEAKEPVNAFKSKEKPALDPKVLKRVEPTRIAVTTTANLVAPVHDKVVINLGEDSSESEDDSNLAVVQLLKQARKNSETQPQHPVSNLSIAQVKEYQRLKEEIAKREQTKNLAPSEELKIVPPSISISEKMQAQMKIAISEDEKQMNELKALLLKKRHLVSLAEQKVKRLQEQMVAAQKVVVANKTAITKLTNQINDFRRRIFDAQGKLSDSKTEMKKKVLSPVRKRPITSLAQAYKKTLVMVNNKSNKTIIPNGITHQQREKGEREKEKARLQKLEQAIALKLKELRHAKGLDKPQKDPPQIAKTTKPLGGLQPEAKKLKVAEAKLQLTKLVFMTNDKLPKQLPKFSQELNVKDLLSPAVKTSVSLTTTKWDFIYFPIVSMPNSINLQLGDLSPSISSDTSQTCEFMLPDPLHHMRSSRLLPSFVTHLTSSTYTKKLNPNWTLCPFDLRGTCNDDKCPWQHASDYSLTPGEIVSDLVSYCPQLCGLNQYAIAEKSEEAIKNYSEKILQGISHHVALEEVLSQLVIEIGKNVPLGERLIVRERIWKLGYADKNKRREVEQKECKENTRDNEVTLKKCKLNESKRYFTSKTYKDKILEEKVVSDPHDICAWIQLAGLKSDWSVSKLNLDKKLHVLSRALEKNRNSEELWLEYLKLYEKHPDSRKDFIELCKQAINYVPSYKIWWKHLVSTENVVDKLDVGGQLINFLKTSKEDADTVSHQFLEVVFYQVQLCLQIGHFQQCVKLLKDIVMNEKKLAVESDLCILWLAYIHLEVFKTLPLSLFSEWDDNPGQLKSHKPILILWQLCKQHHSNAATLLEEAIEATMHFSSPASLPLHQNLIALYMTQKKFDLAEKMAQNLVDKTPMSEDCRILLATVLLQKCNYDSCFKTLETAFNNLAFSPRLQCIATVVVRQFCSEATAHDWLSKSIRRLFASNKEVTENLFRHVLGIYHDVQLSASYLDKSYEAQNELNQMYLWLSYCFFLHLEKRSQDVLETLEIAITTMATAESLQPICLFYLISFAANIGPSVKCNTKKQWLNRYRRYLLMLGSNVSRLASQDELGCQEFTEEMLELLTRNFQVADRMAAVSWVHSWLPHNSAVLLSYLKLLTEEKEYQMVIYYVKEALANNVVLLDASRLTIHAAQKSLPSYKASNLMHELTSALPYSCILWDDAIKTLYNMGNQSGGIQLQKRCKTYTDASGDTVLKKLLSSMSTER